MFLLYLQSNNWTLETSIKNMKKSGPKTVSMRFFCKKKMFLLASVAFVNENYD